MTIVIIGKCPMSNAVMFLADGLQQPELPAVQETSSSEFQPDRLQVLLIGSRQGVTSTIHTLHVLGFAEVGQWSPLLPGPQPGTVVSILTRRLGTPPPA
ncbi:hypothetical protein [Leptolyngbya sp. PCC 6406]|uniref:hypothetical protein n=1 Tax=Leptolyngbya sp. PCC 6406 TaxID=1173264 RepID=UPI001CEC9284|nr:hypothetical protein [Leptolyngbya sp. PCC 6406]